MRKLSGFWEDGLHDSMISVWACAGKELQIFRDSHSVRLRAGNARRQRLNSGAVARPGEGGRWWICCQQDGGWTSVSETCCEDEGVDAVSKNTNTLAL